MNQTLNNMENEKSFKDSNYRFNFSFKIVRNNLPFSTGVS